MTKNVPASIRAKLLALSKSEGTDFQRTLVRYGIERVLYRLSRHDARSRFILKGAMLFTAWPESEPRPTGDLDLLGQGSPDPETMSDLFADICGIEAPEDGLSFASESIRAERLREDEEYQGLRITLLARLDRAEIPFKIDIGFGDAVHPGPSELEFPTLLRDMPAPVISAYPPATVVAEKFEAMVRFGLSNGRLKDYYDIREIARTFGFSRAELVLAINGTFDRRNTERPTEIPIGLTSEFTGRKDKQDIWRAFLDRSAPHQAGLSLEQVAAELTEFLAPVILQLSTPESAVGTWSPLQGWQA